jgi:aminoglycoside phosphotransferase (APT) family kinase protein
MEFVDGVVLRNQLPESLRTGEAARQMGEDIVDTLVEIHALDVSRAGFTELAPTAEHLERQIEEWRILWQHNRTREVPDVDRLGKWFASHPPSSPEPTVIHGLYMLENLVLAAESGRILAVLDWETAAVGDPLTDLGVLTSMWPEPGEGLEGTLNFGAVTPEPGFPTRRDLVERYMHASARDVENLRWYQALAFWKLAILLEGRHKRILLGDGAGSLVGQLEDGVPELASRALGLVRNFR